MFEQLDFGGNKIKDMPKPKIDGRKSSYQQFKISNNYHKSNGKNRCEFCKYFRVNAGYQHNFFKCDLLGLSMSTATDIRKSYVCEKFDRRNKL